MLSPLSDLLLDPSTLDPAIRAAGSGIAAGLDLAPGADSGVGASVAAGAGVGVAASAGAGVLKRLPRPPAPDARVVADAIQAATTDRRATALTRPHDATEVRLGPARIGLRNGRGTSRATLHRGDVTPAPVDSPLRGVLDGARPDAAFASPDAMRAAARTARDRPARWRPADGRLRVRRVTWDDLDLTLVAV